MKRTMPDWMIRAVKTFVQAFFGVLVPEVVTVLQHGWPESWAAVWGYLAPVIAAALAAAIAAVWNILLEKLRGETPPPAAPEPPQEGAAPPPAAPERTARPPLGGGSPRARMLSQEGAKDREVDER